MSFLPAALWCAPPRSLDASLAGVVRDASGLPRMGASVELFDRSGHPLQTALTNQRGLFGFEPLRPDLYSVRVSLASYNPAIKQKIAVQPGMQSLLYVNLTTLLSSIELVYAAPGHGALMSDDWKWTLKTAGASRPVLRLLPETSASDPDRREPPLGAIFSATQALVGVSAGESDSFAGLLGDSDFGTVFALKTTVMGHSRLDVSGRAGYLAESGLPVGSFRAGYSDPEGGPEISFNLRQVYLPAHSLAALPDGTPDGLPALRTLSLAVADHAQIGTAVRLDYGAAFDSVSLSGHANYMSPFIRASYDLGAAGTLRAAYSSGTPPAGLLVRSDSNEADLYQDLALLTMLPQVSTLKGDLAVQRTQSVEAGYEKRVGRFALNVTGYRDEVANGVLLLSANQDLYSGAGMLPGVGADSELVNAGNFHVAGYAVSGAEALGDNLEISAAVGRSGMLLPNGLPLGSVSNAGTGNQLQTGDRMWAGTRIAAKLPRAGTRVSASYDWMDAGALMPLHLSLTSDAIIPEAGLNIHIRQPLPCLFGLPGRLEATADLRNILSQGYLEMRLADGGHAYLTQYPRTIRGGLSFIF